MGGEYSIVEVTIKPVEGCYHDSGCEDKLYHCTFRMDSYYKVLMAKTL